MPTSNHDKASAPLLEWAAAGAGLVLILLLLAVIGRAAISNERSNSPWIELRTGQTKTAASGFFLPIEVSNKAGRAVAALHIARKAGRRSIMYRGMVARAEACSSSMIQSVISCPCARSVMKIPDPLPDRLLLRLCQGRAHAPDPVLA
jgi:hypothetical protein